MNDHIHELQLRTLSIVMNGADPDGDVEKMYIPRVFAERFARMIAMDCMGIWEAIDNGNKIEGTSYFPKAVAKKYGIL